MDVLSLDKDKTHDLEVCLDNEAGQLRLLITISDTRLDDNSSSSSTSYQQSAAQHLNTYTVRSQFNNARVPLLRFCLQLFVNF